MQKKKSKNLLFKSLQTHRVYKSFEYLISFLLFFQELSKENFDVDIIHFHENTKLYKLK